MEYPLQVNFINERAIDLGGVTKDAFSAFFNEAYLCMYPVMLASIDLEMFQMFGRIISHAYRVLPDSMPCNSPTRCENQVCRFNSKRMLHLFSVYL